MLSLLAAIASLHTSSNLSMRRVSAGVGAAGVFGGGWLSELAKGFWRRERRERRERDVKEVRAQKSVLPPSLFKEKGKYSQYSYCKGQAAGRCCSSCLMSHCEEKPSKIYYQF